MHGTPAFICGGASDFGLAGLYLPIRGQGCYLTEVIGRRETFSLLSAFILLASCWVDSCGANHTARPDLPESVSPGWRLSSLDRTAAPGGIPLEGTPECWKAEYAGQGSAQASAQVWVCGYKASAGALDAVQRARAEAQTVKFQQGAYLVLVKWNNVSKASLTALVRAIQKAVPLN
jgi:hypothetical protein